MGAFAFVRQMQTEQMLIIGLTVAFTGLWLIDSLVIVIRSYSYYNELKGLVAANMYDILCIFLVNVMLGVIVARDSINKSFQGGIQYAASNLVYQQTAINAQGQQMMYQQPQVYQQQ
jgi:hypothetical protein